MAIGKRNHSRLHQFRFGVLCPRIQNQRDVQSNYRDNEASMCVSSVHSCIQVPPSPPLEFSACLAAARGIPILRRSDAEVSALRRFVGMGGGGPGFGKLRNGRRWLATAPIEFRGEPHESIYVFVVARDADGDA